MNSLVATRIGDWSINRPNGGSATYEPAIATTSPSLPPAQRLRKNIYGPTPCPLAHHMNPLSPPRAQAFHPRSGFGKNIYEPTPCPTGAP